MNNNYFKEVVFVNELTNGVLDPNQPMKFHLKDGGTIIANTAPGCWGPMITPELKGGHEVTQPVFVEGAEIGDAVAIKIKAIEVTSVATSSGTDAPIEGRFNGDPFVAGYCEMCDKENPKTVVQGVGEDSIKCATCGSTVTPFDLTHGYTMVFNEDKTIGITVDEQAVQKITESPKKYMHTPDYSIQNPIVSFAKHEIPNVTARVIPFLGQLGTMPSKAFPDSHNAGDFGQFLINAPHQYGMSESDLSHRTDGHMDINRVRQGAILLAPVKVKGGGVYMGDMHAMQGNGEIAGHTTDVSGIVQLEVSVIKNLKLKGPILLPLEDDLPLVAKPFTSKELEEARALSEEWGMHSKIEESYPLSFIGTGANLNDATDNGIQRASELLGIPIEEVKNRATITGSIDIGRHPGVVTITFLVPKKLLDKLDMGHIVSRFYKK
ncbi:acetamidase/formamidase family protein [Nosocomiicoccus sp. HMSC059G07]|uniref:acetamidase/formamidase family protein n=1 Tax=Nosocomiicoccus sp. HMSC059G07 TaxID=1739531 RepID=UPI0008A53DA8|nr:acetamidase/formamidase family protein [Nosocomiicoccus sp. HMSC059G07]OFO49077.1 acetamidase [Nosocomiicoccus sp. HMSC059G07]